MEALKFFERREDILLEVHIRQLLGLQCGKPVMDMLLRRNAFFEAKVKTTRSGLALGNHSLAHQMRVFGPGCP